MATKKIIEQLVTELTADGAKMRKELDKSFKDTKSWGDKVTGIAKKAAVGIAAGGATMAAGLAVAVKETVALGREVTQLSALSGTSTGDFQRFAFATKSLGIEQQEAGDILKDTSDKIGDFLQTGAGPMADFFENIAPLVGVTADQFRDLSGRDALQLYVSSLEKANLSQSEMTFFMEAIASDATLLLPLLKNNGAELERLGKRAEELNVVLSEVELKELAEIDKALVDFGGSVDGLVNKIVVGLLPEIKQFTKVLNDPETQAGLTSLANGLLKTANFAIKASAEIGKIYRLLGGYDPKNIDHVEQEIELINKMMQGEESKFRMIGRGGLVEYWDKGELEQEMQRLISERDAIFAAAPPAAVFDMNALQGDSALARIETEAYNKNIEIKKLALKQSEEIKKAKEAEAKEQEKLNQLYASQADSMLREIMLTEQATGLDRLRYEFEFGSLQKITPLQKSQLESMQAELDLRAEIAVAVDKQAAANAALKDVEDILKTDVERVNAAWDARIKIIQDAGLEQARTTELIAKAEEKRATELEDLTKAGADGMSEYAKQAARSMQRAFADFLFDPFEDGLDGLADNFGKILQRMAADAAAAQILESVGAWGKANSGAGGFMGLLGGAASMFFGGAFADGGRPPINKISVVGDGGEPELFVPDTAGTIIPFSKLQGGGGQTMVTNNLTVQGRIDRRTESQIARDIAQKTRMATARG